MSGRTSESMKSHRRAESYRDLVDMYKQIGGVPSIREVLHQEAEKAPAPPEMRLRWSRPHLEQRLESLFPRASPYTQ